MDRERGYVNIDIVGMMLFMAVVGVVAGLILCPLLSWLWAVVKPWLHSITG